MSQVDAEIPTVSLVAFIGKRESCYLEEIAIKEALAHRRLTLRLHGAIEEAAVERV